MIAAGAQVEAAVGAESWEECGRDAAPMLDHVAAVVIVGANPEHAARVALGIARAACPRRRVALADLVGDLAPLYAVAGGADAFGVSDCFRDNLPLGDIARPSPDCDSLFILPAGTPPVACYDVLAHERWPRLIKGFAEAGALLLLVAPIDAQGLDVLVSAVGGVVAVDTSPQRVRRFPVLLSVNAPHARPALPVPRQPRKSVSLLVGGAVLVAGIGAWLAFRPRTRPPRAGAPTAAATRASAVPAPAAARADTVRLGAVVNPGDSARAAVFAVELVAANSAAGANSVLRESEDATSVVDRTTAAVVPVQLDGAVLWYKALVGAWHERGRADSLLDALRARGLVRRNAGLVVRVPYALLLVDGTTPDEAATVVTKWRRRGIAAYALLQEDGSARVFAGAFETPAQAAPLAVTVRDAGVVPVMAFRTGRSF